MPAKKGRPAGFNPPKPESGRYSLDELSRLRDFLKESGLKFWIIAAGIGAILEGFHILWLAFWWLKNVMTASPNH